MSDFIIYMYFGFWILNIIVTGCPYNALNDGPITQRLASKESRLQLLGLFLNWFSILSYNVNRKSVINM